MATELADVKQELERYLQQKGINTKKPFKCLNPAHDDRNPSMSYDRKHHKAHCFACGANYDIFDLVGVEYGLASFPEKKKKAYELLGLTMPDQGKGADFPFTVRYEEPAKPESKADYTEYTNKCHERIGETDYPALRGLNADTIERFRLGYEPAFTINTGGKAWKALIIPNGPNGYTARNIDPKADHRNRVRRPSGSKVIFNLEALDQLEPVYIVEGEIDALSIEQEGGKAVALGGANNTNALLNHLREHGTKAPIILALDNDKNGEDSTKKLEEGLSELNIKPYIRNPYGQCNDANEALQKGKDAFKKQIQGINGEVKALADEELNAEKEAHLKTSALHRIQDFMNGIADSVNTPYIPTGFQDLDKALDGGLYEGLYFIGAISSIGKTTIALQIADQVAKQGKDVLIFSLEMAQAELMSKSISRETLLHVIKNDGEISDAKTNRAITNGAWYARYSATEKKVIQEAIKAYSEYAGHIYIHEGIGNIGAIEVGEIVKQHIKITENTPLVLIDYLQILTPLDPRATEKQNTDRAVISLKRLSRDYKTPIIGISSFNRQNYSSSVNMTAFKESGAIEYGSDVLLGLQLEGIGEEGFDLEEAKEQVPRKMEVRVLKNRNGKAGQTIPYKYYSEFNYFTEG